MQNLVAEPIAWETTRRERPANAEETPHASETISRMGAAEIVRCKTVLEKTYRRYQELGGIINESDYRRALMSAVNPARLDEGQSQIRCSIQQAMGMAAYAKIPLDGSGEHPDAKILMYVMLRLDTRPSDAQHHHSQMCDQRIFVEVVRMLQDDASLKKLQEAYRNISFDYSAA